MPSSSIDTLPQAQTIPLSITNPSVYRLDVEIRVGMQSVEWTLHYSFTGPIEAREQANG
ncbi:hypothetical protein HBH98_066830 [Parastagonospora nodorum]|uniref:Uncharacterized protein n=1 Tax=Phaeosphaeria nodorum (strain SN15 / ATCC MYA-4574 / FGSC 10173) TaxID=321614 RepID=A0A7U2NQJ3_PHANO|nr:hypothetical protein HBH53_053970 [Parastagonospora nodorum]QRD06748.1 hypothetical protein JI435_136500 [Parastagonospora nodorum SN15]KAH4125274.1 hypothetical protein HBH47_064100 [Parastagonospora nodorum]KAH4138948.1 hypothetical protein HBH45_100620 [Parastagonospora nodorum]KAH4166616.1 hypothetical protein HBH44_061780 [Parastagonospora nodorum]